MKNIIIDGIEYTPKQTTGAEVLVRTVNAGVHIGTLDTSNGEQIKLTNARRLWSWEGAFTLSAVATRGVKRDSSRISCSVPEIILNQVIEIIPIVAGVNLSSTEK